MFKMWWRYNNNKVNKRRSENMKNVKCPSCTAEMKITNNTGTVQCYCGYIYEVKQK